MDPWTASVLRCSNSGRVTTLLHSREMTGCSVSRKEENRRGHQQRAIAGQAPNWSPDLKGAPTSREARPARRAVVGKIMSNKSLRFE